MSKDKHGRDKHGKDNQMDTKSTVFEIRENDVFRQLLGEQDQHLRVLQDKLDLRVGRVEGGLKLEGQEGDVGLAFDLLKQLKVMLELGQEIFPGDFERSLKMLASDRHLRLSDVFREQVNISGRKNPIVPKTKGQSIYLDAMRDYDITFGVGPAGTGKTYLAMAMAVAALTKKRVSRVVLCRPAVEAGEKLGFLPGSMEEKVNPYLTPLYDALYDMVDAERAHEMVERGQIEVAPLAFMRGRTLSNAFVIVDEAQNTTPVQMKMILTRLGQGSKLVVTGDVSQIDLPRGVGSGLIDALRVLKTVEDVSINILTEIDVIRHPVVASVLRAYAKYGSESES
jgi:phosphate starvation-inducible PhoH-like protein